MRRKSKLPKGQRGTYTIITPSVTMRNLSKTMAYSIAKNTENIGSPVRIRKQKRKLNYSEL